MGDSTQTYLPVTIEDPTLVENPVIGIGKFILHQNYPNPFNPTTTINYEIARDSHVKLILFNLLGQRIKTLVDAFEHAGVKSIEWDGMNDANEQVAAGVYIYRLEIQNKSIRNVALKKCILAK